MTTSRDLLETIHDVLYDLHVGDAGLASDGTRSLQALTELRERVEGLEAVEDAANELMRCCLVDAHGPFAPSHSSGFTREAATALDATLGALSLDEREEES